MTYRIKSGLEVTLHDVFYVTQVTRDTLTKEACVHRSALYEKLVLSKYLQIVRPI